MEFHFNSKLEEYYQKFVELQEKLRKSEEQRFQLEMKFNEMVHIGRQEQQEHYRKLRAQYKRFLEEDQKRQERNERILRNLERVETRISMLSAKTERIDVLRRQYRNYLIRITNPKTPTIKEEPLNNPKTSLLEGELTLPSFKCTQTQTNTQEQMKILDKYLENMSSRTVLKSEKSPDFNYNSNKASAIAEDIMKSIYSRHYNKIPESGDTDMEKLQKCNFTEPQSKGDFNPVDDFKPLESVYSVAPNETEEQPSREDEEPAFLSALDVTIPTNVEDKIVEMTQIPPSELKPNPEVSTIYYNQDYQPSGTHIDDSESRDEPVEEPGNEVEEEKSNFQVESESKEEVCDKVAESDIPVENEIVVQLEETHIEESEQKEVHDELENPIDPVESTENFDLVRPSETREEVQGVTDQNAEVENPIVPVESTENSDIVQPSETRQEVQGVMDQNAEVENFPVDDTANSEVEQPSEDQLAEDHQTEPYYQPDLTYSEQYDQQQGEFPPGYDQYGQPLVYNQHGEIVQPQFDENGQMLPQYDENGQLIMWYDHEGRAYFEETQPAYEDYEGVNDQAYREDEQQDAEGNEQQDEEGNEQRVPEHTDLVGCESEQKVEEHHETMQQEVVESIRPEEEIKDVEVKLGNVMDILDTDTEASSKNISKVSNDTDFDFS